MSRDRRRLQRGGGDRAAAREPARARLPGRPARDRRRLGRVDRPHERARRGGRRARAARPAARLPARRQGRRAGPRRARDARARSSRSPTRTRPGRRMRCGTLVANLADPDVAYVCGRLRLEDADGLEPRGRSTGATSCGCARQESRLGSITGGNGSIYARAARRLRRGRPALGARPLASRTGWCRRAAARSTSPRRSRSRSRRRRTRPSTARKVRMFEHCWEITLRGSMLRRLPPGYLVEIVSHRAAPLRQRGAPPRAARDERRARRRPAGRTRSCSPASSPLLAAVRGRRPDRALLRARHVGDRRRALELPPPRRARDLGGRGGHAVNRALDVALAGARARRREPAARRRRARGQARGRRPGALPADARRQGRRGLRAAQAAHDGRRRRAAGRRATRSTGATRGSRASGRVLRRHVDRRAAAALERRPRRHVP